MKKLKIFFYLIKNYFKNGQEVFRAAVHSKGAIDQAGLIRSMIYRGSSINESDILAVLRDYYDAIYEALLNGHSVTTPLVNVRVSIRGNFNDTQDTFDPERHEIVAVTNAGVELKEYIKSKAVVQKEESLKPLPNPTQFRNLSNGRETHELAPGKLAQVTGRRLKYDPADPAQGLFLLNNGTALRVEPDGKIANSELVFLVPATLEPGEYRLEVRAVFGKSDLRIGQLAATLTVPVV
jgi:hypothetical protein